jgi:hypothetical protein
MKSRVAENLAIATVIVGLVLAGVLGKLTTEEGEPFDWLLAMVTAGPFIVSAAVLTAAALLLGDR